MNHDRAVPLLLLVDDRPDNLEVLRAVIAQHLPECSVMTAESAEQGLALSERHRFDGALVDVQMPGMDGIEMCRRLKEDPTTARTPVLLITARTTDALTRVQGLRAGADGFLSKPIDNEELVAHLRVMLRIRAVEEELRRTKDNLERTVEQRTEELSREKERAQSYLDIAATIIIALDLQGRLLLLNQEGARMLGTDPERAVGQPWFETFIAERDRERVCRWFELQMAGVDTTPSSEYIEASVVSSAGEERLVRWHAGRVPEGGDAVLLCSGEDITERRQAELARQRSAQRWQSTFDAITDSIAILSPQHELVEVNQAACKAIGLSPEKLIGRKCFEVVHGTTEPVPECPCARALSTGEAASGELIERGRCYSLAAWPIFDDNGTLTGFTHIVRDVTQQKLMEEQLRQSQKLEAVGRLAGGIAHDFNNQLASILGYADLLAEELQDQVLSHHAEGIITAATRSAKMITQLLSFARKGPQEFQPVDMHRLIGEVVSMLAHTIDPRIEVFQRLNAEHAVISGEPALLQNALLNLAINAGDAMPDGGELIFCTRLVDVDGSTGASAHLAPGRYLQLQVSDSGFGMEQETTHRIFDPFFTTKEPGRGTGMGLASVYGTVQSHNGSITVDSIPSRGTTFTLLLPAGADSPSTWVPVASDPELPQARIMVVDDEPDVRDLAARMLTRLGHEVTTCEDGTEAIELFRRSGARYDLIILDMMMPRISGRDTLNALREIDPAVKILVCTGCIDEQARDLLGEGAAGLLQKPFRLGTLRKKLVEILRD